MEGYAAEELGLQLSYCPEGPSTQYLRSLVPETIVLEKVKVLGRETSNIRYLDPLGCAHKKYSQQSLKLHPQTQDSFGRVLGCHHMLGNSCVLLAWTSGSGSASELECTTSFHTCSTSGCFGMQACYVIRKRRCDIFRSGFQSNI